jgi:hypothetical protein
VVNIKMIVFWVVALCILVEVTSSCVVHSMISFDVTGLLSVKIPVIAKCPFMVRNSVLR